jgi:zinc-ribbon domain
MFCSKCGTESLDDSQFCRKCGKAMSTGFATSGTGAAAAPALAPAKKKSRVALWILLALLAIVIYWVATSHSPGAQKFQQLAKDQHTLTLNQPDFAVKANSYGYSKFEVPAGASGAHSKAISKLVAGLETILKPTCFLPKTL